MDRLLLMGIAAGWACMLAVGALEWVLRQAPVLDTYMVTCALAASLSAGKRRQPFPVAAKAHRTKDMAPSNHELCNERVNKTLNCRVGWTRSGQATGAQ